MRSLSLATLVTLGLASEERTAVNFSMIAGEPMLKLQMLGTHNSYHLRTEKFVPDDYVSYDSLTAQYIAGVRAFEFDVWKTPIDDLFLIYHIETYDERSTVSNLTGVFDIMKQWFSNSAIYAGEPAYVGLEIQRYDEWAVEDYENLDTLIRTELAGTTFKPSDLGANPDMPREQWPDWTDVMVSDLTNKVVIRAVGRNLPDYFNANKTDGSGEPLLNAAEMAFFYSCRWGDREDPYCRIFNVNDANKRQDRIETLGAQYMVKCNADSSYLEIPDTEFSTNENGTWMATYSWTNDDNYETERTTVWGARYMFQVIDLDEDGSVSWNETEAYVDAATENDLDVLLWARDNVRPLCPIVEADYDLLEDLYIQVWDYPNTDYNYTRDQAEAAIASGCQIIQTEHVFQTLGDNADDDYSFNLGCGHLSDVEYLFNGTYCVVFSENGGDDDDGDDGDDGQDDDDSAVLASIKSLTAIVALAISAQL